MENVINLDTSGDYFLANWSKTWNTVTFYTLGTLLTLIPLDALIFTHILHKGKIHPVTSVYFLTLTAGGTHTTISGRKYTPIIGYTSSFTRALNNSHHVVNFGQI